MIGKVIDALESHGDELAAGIGEAFGHLRDAADADTAEAVGSNVWEAMKAVGGPTAGIVLVVGLLYLGYRAVLRFRSTVAVGLPFALLWAFMPHATATGTGFMRPAVAFAGAGAAAFTLMYGLDRAKYAVGVVAPPVVGFALVRAWRPDVVVRPEFWVATLVILGFYLPAAYRLMRDHDAGRV